MMHISTLMTIWLLVFAVPAAIELVFWMRGQ